MSMIFYGECVMDLSEVSRASNWVGQIIALAGSIFQDGLVLQKSWDCIIGKFTFALWYESPLARQQQFVRSGQRFADFKMSDFEVYEFRLRLYLRKLLSRPGTELSESFLTVIPSRSLEQWAQDVSKITLPAAKSLLQADRAPTDEELVALPKTKGVYKPGVYQGTILTPGDPSDSYGYDGSATAPAEGIEGRILQHQNPEYRARYMKRGGSLHYAVLEAAGMNRYGEYRVLCQAEFESGAPADIFYTRATCLMAEQLYMSWLKNFGEGTLKKHRWLSELTPWASSPRKGLNGRLPIAEGIPGSKNEVSPLTPEERQVRLRDHQRYLKSLDTVEERQHRQTQNSIYYYEVMKPVMEMRKSGVPETDIKAFQDAHRKKTQAVRPKNGFKFSTATPRSEEERALDLSGERRHNGKTSVLASISGNAAPAKKAKVELNVVEKPPAPTIAPEISAPHIVAREIPLVRPPPGYGSCFATASWYLKLYHEERDERSVRDETSARGNGTFGYPG